MPTPDRRSGAHRVLEDPPTAPPTADELVRAAVAVEDLVPAGRPTDAPPPLVFENGGTTGPPARIVELGFWARSVRRLSRCLDDHGIPPGGNRLHLGHTGHGTS